MDGLIYCYYTEASQDTRERMWRYIRHYDGWICAHPWGMYLYILRDKSAPLLLLDPNIERRPEKDYLL